jgi:hypothetical protein
MTVRLETDRTYTDEVLSGILNIPLDCGQKCEISIYIVLGSENKFSDVVPDNFC